MRYIKYGFIAIAAQTINAKCRCCKNNNNVSENNKSEEDLFIDEIVKLFNVTKDKIIIKKKITIKDKNYYQNRQLTEEEIQTVTNRYTEETKTNAELKLYEFSKVNLKSKNGIYVSLLTEKMSIDNTKLNILLKMDADPYYDSNKDIDIYIAIDMMTKNYCCYIKKS